MKWRPNDGDADSSMESDRHPARAAGVVDVDASTSTADSATADSVEPVGTSPTLVLAPDSMSPDASTMASDGADPDHIPESDSGPVVTSRTWNAEGADASRRHPATPSLLGVASAVSSARPSAPRSSRTGLLSAAGWFVAVGIGVVWLLQGTGAARSTSPPSARVTLDPAASSDQVLARPAEDAFEVELAHEEIASLRHERARLMQEVRAAEILLEDHRRLATELRDSTVTNAGAAVELGVLESEARRWQRRHDVAMSRMDELAQLLVEADEQVATLTRQLDETRARLEALDASNGAD